MVHETAVSTWAEPAHNVLLHVLLLRNTYFWGVNVTQNCVHRWNRILPVPAQPPSQQKTRHRSPGLARPLYQSITCISNIPEVQTVWEQRETGVPWKCQILQNFIPPLQEALGRGTLSKEWVLPTMQALLLFMLYDLYLDTSRAKH